MKLANCTPHKITLFPGIDDIMIALEPTGVVPRVTTLSTLDYVITLDDGVQIDVWKSVNADLFDIPPYDPDTINIVSQLVAASCPNRKDLVYPNDLVRNDEGVIIGCKSLAFKG